MTDAPTLDAEHLARATLGDPALEAELFGLFREQARQWLRLLEPAADDAAWGAAAHSLKGSARALGAFALAEACAAAEALVGPGVRPTARSAAAETVRARLNEALEAMGRLEHRAALRALRPR